MAPGDGPPHTARVRRSCQRPADYLPHDSREIDQHREVRQTRFPEVELDAAPPAIEVLPEWRGPAPFFGAIGRNHPRDLPIGTER